MAQRWDIFCNVVDNFGDVGVCWRLARQLAHEHGFNVRLWLDDVDALANIWHFVDVDADEQIVDNVCIQHWYDAVDWSSIQAAEVVIEAFACKLPAAYIDTMLECKRISDIAPVWINLEYLSAESWVEGCHGLSSPQNNGLTKTFFFPGFNAHTGGLLRESKLLTQRDDYLIQTPNSWATLTGFENHSALKVLLFGYDHMPLDAWLPLLLNHPQPIQLAVTAGKATTAVQAACEELNINQNGEGALSIRYIPMLQQDIFDQLLWSADINFIRGEDSFVRALWAGKPLTWHIYPQDDGVHIDKLNAFIERYIGGANVEQITALEAWANWQRFWNGALNIDVKHAWQQMVENLPILKQQAHDYANTLVQFDDLAQQLRQTSARITGVHNQKPL